VGGLAQRVASGYLQLIANVASAALGGGLAILLGVSPLPTSFPLAPLAAAQPVVTLCLGALFIVLVALAVSVTERGRLGQWFSRRLGPRTGRFLFSTALATAASAAIGAVLGFNTLPSSLPLLGLIRTHPPLGIGLLLALLALLIGAPLFGWSGGGDGDAGGDLGGEGSAQYTAPGGGRRQNSGRLVAATAISTVSALLFVALLTVVVIRPAWCPNQICPAPVVVTNQLGDNDGTLEIFYTATESATNLLPGDVSQYSQAQRNLPQETGAIRSDVASYPPYKAVVGVHSLQRVAGTGVIFQQLQLVLDQVAAPPHPCNSWVAGAGVDYNSNPYLVSYGGQGAGARLTAVSTHQPTLYTELNEGESDEFDLQVTSAAPVSLRFHVQALYTIKGEATLHTLALTKHEFALVASDATNWRPYQLDQDSGKLTPAP
jgi:hypothetical protein